MSLRWVWSLMAAVAVMVVGAVMLITINEIEKRAWLASEQEQSRLLVTLLADELKMPMMANSKTEVEALVQLFMSEVPAVKVYLKWSNGDEENYGDMMLPASATALKEWPTVATQVRGAGKWYVMSIRYSNSRLGDIALYNPGVSWQAYGNQIKWRMAAAATLVALMVALLVFVMSGSIRNALRLLARAARRVGGGDFSAQLPIQSSNEFGKAFHQFNQMVSNLEQRENLYDIYGHYQRPQQVADEFDRNAQRADKKQLVTVLSIHLQGVTFGKVKSPQDDALRELNINFTLLRYIVQAFGGHVNQLSGDEMVVVFNHPFELKCHENQAAKAGMAIASAAARLSKAGNGESTLKFRLGLAIGEVVVGYLGQGRRRQLTVVGAPIALASQLATAVVSDGVVALYDTMLELGHGFRPQEIGNIELADGKVVRCINIMPSELYVEQEIEDVVEKVFQRLNPVMEMGDEQW
ncbi:MAG: HAMP domain-containing protein [Mariprofundus sp.]|nr:HAMP domain-containing protein [Mariprofundus sp.]